MISPEDAEQLAGDDEEIDPWSALGHALLIEEPSPSQIEAVRQLGCKAVAIRYGIVRSNTKLDRLHVAQASADDPESRKRLEHQAVVNVLNSAGPMVEVTWTPDEHFPQTVHLDACLGVMFVDAKPEGGPSAGTKS